MISKTVVVEAEPNMQAVFFDAIVDAPATRTFAAQSPPVLIDGDARELVAPSGTTELERGRDPCHPAAENHDSWK